MSDATRLLESFPGLVDRRPPSFDYRSELHLDDDDPPSPNKETGARGAFAVDSLNRGRVADVDLVLAREIRLAGQPFMQNESLTPEPIYRQLHALPHHPLMGCAAERGNDAAFDAARRLARSHFTWLLLGVAPGPGRSVLDQQLTAPSGQGLALRGVGKPSSDLSFVAQAGMRCWVRDRENGTGRFMFTDEIVLECIVAQGLGRPWPKKRERPLADTVEKCVKRWPRVLVWGLDEADRLLANRFADEPTSADLAERLLRWLLIPRLPFRITRYVDGSVVFQMLVDHNSTTDPLMICAWYAPGDTVFASAADGVRKNELRVYSGEEDGAFTTWEEGEQAIRIRVPKPAGAVAYVVESDGQRVRLLRGGRAEPLPPTPPGEAPAPPNTSRRPRRRGFGSSL